MYIFQVLLPKIKTPILYYKSDIKYQIGDVVIVPFRGKEISAIIWQESNEQLAFPLKSIINKQPFKANIQSNLLKFINKASQYYLSDLGSIAKLVLPVDINESPIKIAQQTIDNNINLATLSPEQQDCLDEINNSTKPIIIKGVTGSGKTEVYFHAVMQQLKTGKQALIMLPEIALSKQIISRFTKRFGFEPAVWNSSVSKVQKKRILRGIITGSIKVVIGARSALFLPYKNLGIIVVDEEHDPSYKQNDGVTYNARDMAVMRVRAENCKILLVSATPSIESLYNAQSDKIVINQDPSTKSTTQGAAEDKPFSKPASGSKMLGDLGAQDRNVLNIHEDPSTKSTRQVAAEAGFGKYYLIKLLNRHNKATMPDIKIINMKEENLPMNNWLSRKVIESIKENNAKGQQTLIFLNRKGYAPLMLCKACGHKIHCNSCSSSMVIHKKQNKMECHHCGYNRPIYKKCPECNDTNNLVMCGPGIERIEEEIKLKFDKCRVATISKDHTTSEQKMQELLTQMENNEIDILIGTQIITKGYHFSNLTLVVVVDADIGFVGGDLRSSERTFQLLHQVSGRAGREEQPGTVLMQTYMPDNKVLQSIIQNKEDEYIQTELSARKSSHMPPFSKVATITITGKNELKTKEFAHNFTRQAPKSSAKIMGPSEAMMHKIAGKYRYKILIVANKSFNLQSYIQYWLDNNKIPSSYHLKIDIDPQELL